VVLGLAHFISIVSADALANFDNLPLFRDIGGATYTVLVTLVESVISEDPELYASIQMNLPSLTSVEELFQNRVRTWADLVKNKDRQGFVERMTVLKDKLEKCSPHFGEAYENVYKMMAAL